MNTSYLFNMTMSTMTQIETLTGEGYIKNIFSKILYLIILNIYSTFKPFPT